MYGFVPNGVGVSGRSPNGIGVYGNSTHGQGAYGISSDGTGVYGYSTSGTGVYGFSGSSFAGYFDGKVKIASGGLEVVGGCTGCTNMVSDRNLKTNFASVNPRFILDRLSAIPIREWNYKTDELTVRHIGAMAQDFRAAFGFGESDKTLNTVDAQGVTMASIQALYQMMQEKDRQIERLQSQVT